MLLGGRKPDMASYSNPSVGRWMPRVMDAGGEGDSDGNLISSKGIRREKTMSTNASAPQTTAGAEHLSTRSPLRGMRVLVAEDGLVNQHLARRVLLEEGCRVTVVADGAEAFRAACRAHFDAIIMDIDMPGMDGLTATRHIRNWESRQGKRTPIIAWTATACERDCREAGMDGILAKPFDVTVLSSLMKHLLHSDAA